MTYWLSPLLENQRLCQIHPAYAATANDLFPRMRHNRENDEGTEKRTLSSHHPPRGDSIVPTLPNLKHLQEKETPWPDFESGKFALLMPLSRTAGREAYSSPPVPPKGRLGASRGPYAHARTASAPQRSEEHTSALQS